MVAVTVFVGYSLSQNSDNFHSFVGLSFGLVFVRIVANMSSAAALELALEPATDAKWLK